MFCKFCSAQIDPNAEHCYACGRRLSEQDKLLSKPEIEHKTPIEYIPKSVGTDDIRVYNLGEGTTAMQKTEINKKSSVTAVVIAVLSVLAAVGITLSVLFATGVITVGQTATQTDGKEGDSDSAKNNEEVSWQKGQGVLNDAIKNINEADESFGSTYLDNERVQAILDYCNNTDFSSYRMEREDEEDGYMIWSVDNNGNKVYAKGYFLDGSFSVEAWAAFDTSALRMVMYDENGDKLKDIFSDRQGNILLIVRYEDGKYAEAAGYTDYFDDKQYRYMYTFSDDTFLDMVFEFDKAGNQTAYTAYNDNNVVIGCGTNYSDGSTKTYSHYNENGELTEMEEFYSRTEANGKDRFKKETFYTDGSVSGYNEYSIDENGEYTEYRYYDEKYELTELWEVYYSEEHMEDVTEITYYDETGNIKSAEVWGSEGNLIDETVY